jgi:uncharacterized protein (DUF2147 family)
MNTIRTALLIMIFSMSAAIGFAQEDGDRLVGVWEPSHGKAKVKIEKIGSKYYGKIVWLKQATDPETNEPRVDINNPDESMRKTPLRGYRILKDFIYSDKNEWTEGTIYDPENGSTYSCVIKMKDDNTIEIRGFIGVSALGRTDVWKRLQMPKKK